MRCINANEVVPSRVYATPCPSAENSCTQPAMLGRLHVPWPAMTNPEFRSSLLTWISVHCDRWKGCKLIREGLPCITCIYQKHSKAASDKGLPFSPPANKQEDCKPTSTVHTAYYSFMVTVLPKNQVRVCTHENPSLCKCTLSVALESSNCPGSCKPACSSERDAFCSCLMNVLRAIEVHKRQKNCKSRRGSTNRQQNHAVQPMPLWKSICTHYEQSLCPVVNCPHHSQLSQNLLMPYHALRAAHLDLILSLWANRAYFSENLSTTSSWVRYSSGS